MSLLITKGLGSAVDVNGLLLSSVTNSGTYLDLLFNMVLNVSSNVLEVGSWAITAGGIVSPVQISAVSTPSLKTIRVAISEQTNGATYTLHLPKVGILALDDTAYNGPFEANFVGVGAGPFVTMVRSIDARTLEIFFNEPVDEGDALNPSNYSISGGLQVTAVSKLTPIQYQITTSKQTENVNYTVTVSNVRDAHLNG